MTFLEVNYHYTGPLARDQMERIGDLPGRYGIRRLHLDEDRCIARIEFDASRLKESEVVHWIRRAGIPLTKRVLVDESAA